MSDKIRDEFEKFLRMVDIGRDRSGFMPLTAREAKVLKYGFSGGWEAALAQQPAPRSVGGVNTANNTLSGTPGKDMDITNKLLDELEVEVKESITWDDETIEIKSATVLALVEHIRSLTERMEKSPRWISVDEKLPPARARCLICRVGKKTSQKALIAWKTGSPYAPWEYADGSRVEFRVTHWMPAPELPAIAQEGAHHE